MATQPFKLMRVQELTMTPPVMTGNMKTLHYIIEVRSECGHEDCGPPTIKKIRCHASRAEGTPTKLILYFTDGRIAQEVPDVRIRASDICPCQPSHLFVILRNHSHYYEGCGDFNSSLSLTLGN